MSDRKTSFFVLGAFIGYLIARNRMRMAAQAVVLPRPANRSADIIDLAQWKAQSLAN